MVEKKEETSHIMIINASKKAPKALFACIDYSIYAIMY